VRGVGEHGLLAAGCGNPDLLRQSLRTRRHRSWRARRNHTNWRRGLHRGMAHPRLEADAEMTGSYDNYHLTDAARQEMAAEGFQPDFTPDMDRQLATIHPFFDHQLRDLTGLLWSSIDNDESRDLD